MATTSWNLASDVDSVTSQEGNVPIDTTTPLGETFLWNENFSGGDINPVVWSFTHPSIGDNQLGYTVSGGALRPAAAGVITQDEAIQFFAGAIFFGDYTIEFDQDDFQVTYNDSEVELFMQIMYGMLNAESGATWQTRWEHRIRSHEGSNSNKIIVRVVDDGVSTIVGNLTIQLAQRDITFRIVQSGTSVEWFYDIGSGFVSLATYTFSALPPPMAPVIVPEANADVGSIASFSAEIAGVTQIAGDRYYPNGVMTLIDKSIGPARVNLADATVDFLGPVNLRYSTDEGASFSPWMAAGSLSGTFTTPKFLRWQAELNPGGETDVARITSLDVESSAIGGGSSLLLMGVG